MATSSEVFDPTAVERPRIRLLGDVFQLAEYGAKRMQAINQIQQQLEELDDDAQDRAVGLMCEMLQISVERLDGSEAVDLGGDLLDAFNQERGGVTLQSIMRAAKFAAEWQQGQMQLGEA